MSPTLTTFLFEAANFLVLAGVLAWLLFKPVSNKIEARRAEQQRLADEAATKLADAERLQVEIRQKHAILDNELQRLREEALTAAKQEAETILTKAREAAQREHDASKRELSHLEQTQTEHLASAIAATARVVVERLLKQVDAPELESGLRQALCRQLESFDGNSLAPVVVESAKPLGVDERASIETALGAGAATAEFRVVPSLQAGVRVSTNRGLVDASAAALATFAERRLAEQLSKDGVRND